VITFFLLAALPFPQPQRNAAEEVKPTPVAPEQVLAWQMEGLTQEEIREEVRTRGLTEYPEIAVLSALSAAGADEETIRAIRATKAPKKIWKLGLRLAAPTDYLYEIVGAMIRNDPEAASAAIQDAAEKQPRNPDVHLIYAFLAQHQGDWIQAYAESTRAASMVPAWPYAHGLRSAICSHSGLSDCAVREARIFVKLRPQDAAAYIALGRGLETHGNFVESLDAYREAQRLHAGYSAIYEGMGRVFAQIGESDKAAVAFEQAIKMENGNAPDYSCQLAQLYLAEGDAQKAIATLQQAKQQNPERLDVLLALGNAYAIDKQYAVAIREFRSVLTAHPDSEPAREQLADALRASGRDEEAAQMYADPGVGSKPEKHE
jgi:Flp pilus assembly protein TadD